MTLALLSPEFRDALHTFTTAREDEDCFFRAHFSAKNRRGAPVVRYLEVRHTLQSMQSTWTYRSGYRYHDNRQFWSVPAEDVSSCEEFARFVAQRTAEAHKRAMMEVESVASRARISIVGSY